jgi:hypothetical protein
VAQEAGAALQAGLDPAATEADALVDALVAAFGLSAGRPDDEGCRRELLEQLELRYEPPAERYWQLPAIINGLAPVPDTMAAWGWFVTARPARAPGDTGAED